MCVIGLTGSLGTGKSRVAAIFKKLGAKVINADRIAHQLMVPQSAVYKKIVKEFGKEILISGRINRKQLGTIVFQDLKKLRKLERIIHPAVRKVIISKIRQFKKRRRNSIIVVDVPLLFESKLHKDVDCSIVVKASKDKQITRAKKQLGLTRMDALRRINAQMPLRKKIRLADMIIDNNGTLTNTQKQVKQIWEKL